PGSGIDLKGCENDASKLASVLRTLGRLDDSRVYLNEKATRKQMEEAITGWLRSVSRPGDTVILFHAGHGDQLADDDGDELDGMDEYIVPHDFAHRAVFEAILAKASPGKLLDPWGESVRKLVHDALGPPPSAGQRYEEWARKANNLLIRRTAVTDDTYGRWIQ